MSHLLNRWVLHRAIGYVLVLLVGVVTALVYGWLDVRVRQAQRLSLLQTEAQRSSIEIMSQTLNGNLMGSITLLGLIDRDIKQEASNGLLSLDAHIAGTLSTLGNSFGAEGVFVVGQNGFVKTSWDRVNRPSTGLDVNFRPYYQMAMRGQNSVYAAVSMARGDRSLYFSAPVFPEHARSQAGIGAVVARTDLSRVDALIRDKFDIALLLSPQGVVFASNQADWIGYIDEAPSAQRLSDIRRLKQFGALFEEAVPLVLPMQARTGMQEVQGRRYALASTPVQWNDPSGEWKLVVLEDLQRSVPVQAVVQAAVLAGLLSMVLASLLLHMARGRFIHLQAHARLQEYAAAQEANLRYRTLLADVSRDLQHCDSVQALAQRFLSVAREAFGAYQGVVYVRSADRPSQLTLAASAAASAALAPEIALGEGMLGQCAAEGRGRVLDVQADGFWNLRSGLGNTRPAVLVLMPLALQEQVLGAVELALAQQPDAATLQRIEEMLSLLAMNLELRHRSPSVAPPLGPDAGHKGSP